MKYIYCVLIPLLLQLVIVYTIIEMNTGNGSWLGLAAFLFAIPVVPVTAIINAVRTGTKKDKKQSILFLQSILIAFIVPIAFLSLFIVMTIIEEVF